MIVLHITTIKIRMHEVIYHDICKLALMQNSIRFALILIAHIKIKLSAAQFA